MSANPHLKASAIRSKKGKTLVGLPMQRFRGSVLQFLICLAVYLFGYPILQELYGAEWVRLIVTTLVLMS